MVSTTIYTLLYRASDGAQTAAAFDAEGNLLSVSAAVDMPKAFRTQVILMHSDIERVRRLGCFWVKDGVRPHDYVRAIIQTGFGNILKQLPEKDEQIIEVSTCATVH